VAALFVSPARKLAFEENRRWRRILIFPSRYTGRKWLKRSVTFFSQRKSGMQRFLQGARIPWRIYALFLAAFSFVS
jgi:hypothetical protein